MTRHLFRTIDDLLRPNNSTGRYRLDPIYVKNMKKGNARWSTTKTVLGWAIDTTQQVLNPLQSWK